MQRNALRRSRRELSNAYLLAKFGFNTADNEPSKVRRIPAAGSSDAQPGEKAEVPGRRLVAGRDNVRARHRRAADLHLPAEH